MMEHDRDVVFPGLGVEQSKLAQLDTDDALLRELQELLAETQQPLEGQPLDGFLDVILMRGNGCPPMCARYVPIFK